MPENRLDILLRQMDPVLNDGEIVYAFAAQGSEPATAVQAIGMFREAEGTTYLTTPEEARRAGLAVLWRAGWITLRVPSDLSAVGFTAAFSTALGDAGISCNVVAAAVHDHVFVPLERAQQALEVLRALQQRAATACALATQSNRT